MEQVWIFEIYKGLQMIEQSIVYGTYEDADTRAVSRMCTIGGTDYIVF